MIMIKYFLLIVSIIFISACSPMSPVKMPKEKSYALDSVSKNRIRAFPTNKTILVSIPTASPGYQTSDIVYIERAYQLNRYTKNKWVAKPSKMFKSLLMQSLRNTNYYKAVVTVPFAGISNLRLDTQIIEIAQHYSPNSNYARVVVKADLISTSTNKVVSSRSFESSVPIQENTPYAVVVSSNRAVGKILNNIINFTIKYS